MFKKTFLALAVAGFAAGASAAPSTMTAGGLGQGTPNNGAILVSAEGAAGATAFDIKTNTLTFTVGSDKLALYGSLAKIRLTLTGATFSPATVIDGDVNNVAGTGADDLNLPTAPTFTAGNVVEFAYSGTAANIAATDTITVSGMVLTPEALTSGSEVVAKIELLSNVGGALIDSATADLTNVVTQYSAKVSSKLSKTIDVTEDRLKFTDGTSNDSLTLEIKSKQVNLLAADATTAGNKGSFTVYGDFSYLDADGDNKIDSGVSVKTAGSTAVTFADGFQSFTVKGDSDLTGDGAAADTDTQVINITGDSKRVMTSQSYTADIKFGYKDAKSTAQNFAVEGTSAGSWGLNGTTVNVPYIPVNYDTLSANLEISNTSGVDAEITIDGVDQNGVAHGPVKLSKVAAKKAVTKVSEADIVAAFGLTAGTKLSLNVVVNSPSGVTVYPYYRENDVRVSLPTSQYRPVECKTTVGTFAVAGGNSTGAFTNTCTAK